MKKALLFLAALTISSTASFAQQKVDGSNLLRQAKAYDLASPNAMLRPAQALRKAPGGAAGSVYYHRPAGVFYVGIDTQFRNWQASILAVPAFTDIVFENASKDPSKTKWKLGTDDAKNVKDNNLIYRVGPSKISNGSLSTYYMPVLTDGTDSFTLSQENKDNPNGGIAAPDSIYNFCLADPNHGFFYGGQGPTVYFGDRDMKYDGKPYKQTAFYQIYSAALSGLYINEIHLPAWNATKGATNIVPDGAELTATILKVVDGAVTNDVIATFKATKDDVTLNETSDITGRMGIVTFHNKQDDGFGGKVDAPAIIEKGQQFAVVISGFSGTKMGFHFGQAPDYNVVSGDGNQNPYVFAPNLPEVTHVMCTATDESVVDLQYGYPFYALIHFQGFQDQVLFNETYTNKDTQEVINHLVLDISKDGGEAQTTQGDPAYVFSARPFVDADGIENYTVKIDYDGAEPWLKDEFTINNQFYAKEGITLFTVSADALPAGVKGRHAFITLEGKGVKSNKLVVRQGDDQTTAINSASVVETANGEMFNLAGQKVNKNFKGIVIKDGKKFINK